MLPQLQFENPLPPPAPLLVACPATACHGCTKCELKIKYYTEIAATVRKKRTHQRTNNEIQLTSHAPFPLPLSLSLTPPVRPRLVRLLVGSSSSSFVRNCGDKQTSHAANSNTITPTAMRRQGVAAQRGTGQRESFAQALPATVTIIKRKRNRKTKATDSLQRAIKSTTTISATTAGRMGRRRSTSSTWRRHQSIVCELFRWH